MRGRAGGAWRGVGERGRASHKVVVIRLRVPASSAGAAPIGIVKVAARLRLERRLLRPARGWTRARRSGSCEGGLTDTTRALIHTAAGRLMDTAGGLMDTAGGLTDAAGGQIGSTYLSSWRHRSRGPFRLFAARSRGRSGSTRPCGCRPTFGWRTGRGTASPGTAQTRAFSENARRRQPQCHDERDARCQPPARLGPRDVATGRTSWTSSFSATELASLLNSAAVAAPGRSAACMRLPDWVRPRNGGWAGAERRHGAHHQTARQRSAGRPARRPSVTFACAPPRSRWRAAHPLSSQRAPAPPSSWGRRPAWARAWPARRRPPPSPPA